MSSVPLRSLRPPPAADPTDLGAARLAQAIRGGELRSADVVRAHLDRIARDHDTLNALAISRAEVALEEARAVDARRARGEALGPLAGVPVTVKEQFALAGTDCTLGVLRRRGAPSAEDGHVVGQLRRAGAVILGKSNLTQLLMAAETDNPVYGRTQNPWDPTRTPGGSTGGGAALVASGGSALDIGSDFGGSLRGPAHFTGLYALKPTSGLIPPDLQTPTGSGFQQVEALFAQAGPLARSVDDLALALEVLTAGAWTEKPPGLDRQDAPARLGLGDLTIGWFDTHPLFDASPAIKRGVAMAAEALGRAGATLAPFPVPRPTEAIGLFLSIVCADGGAWMRRALAGERPHELIQGALLVGRIPAVTRPALGGLLSLLRQPSLAFLLGHTAPQTPDQLAGLLRAVQRYRRDFLAAMAGVDLVLCPPYGLAAPRHGDTADMPLAESYAMLFNLLGFPAGVAPITRVSPDEESDRPVRIDLANRAARRAESGSAGLPVGVQLAARPGREDLVLRVMKELEQQFPRPHLPRSHP